MRRKNMRRQLELAILIGFLCIPHIFFAAPVSAQEEVRDGDMDRAIPMQEEEKAPEVQRLGTMYVYGTTPEDGQSYAAAQVHGRVHLGMLGNHDKFDVPFSFSQFDEKTIENRQERTLAELISVDPSVTNQTLSGASSAWAVRGFRFTHQDVQLNGLYGIAPRFYNGLENVQRVDVLKGPAVLLSGMAPGGSLGGVVNYITKRAPKEELNRVTLSYGDGQTFTKNIDIGRRTEDGRLGVRLNLMNRTGDTSAHEGMRTDSASVGLDYKGDRFRVGLDYSYVDFFPTDQQYQVQIQDTALNTMGQMFKVPKGTKMGNDGNYRHVYESYGMVHGEYDFSDTLTGFFSYGRRFTKMSYFYNDFRLTNANGTAQYRYRYNGQINNAESVEIGLRGYFDTGHLSHEVTLSANRIHHTRYMKNRTIGGNFTTNIHNISFQNISNPYAFETPKNDENTLMGIGFADVITTENNKWKFLLGGRYQKVKTETYDTSTGAVSSKYNESRFTPSAGIVYQPTEKMSLYANYMQGLDIDNARVTDTGASNYGATFSPFKTEQYELGMKYDLGKWGMNLAFFQIDTPVLIEENNIYAPTGERRHRGMELTLYNEPQKGTRFMLGAAYLDAKYTATKDGEYDGNRVVGTSKWNVIFGAEQDVASVPGLTFTARMNYSSDAYINQANTFRVSPWLTWDLGARYSWKAGKVPVTLRLDVLNVGDKNYWRAVGNNNNIFLAKSRTFMLSVSADL